MSILVVTTIQTDLFWEDKKANLQMLQQKIDGIKEKTQVIVLPEMFSTGFSMQPDLFGETMDGETIQWMKKISREKNSILTGSVIIKEDQHFFNRLIWMMPNGQYGQYDKRHLFAFGKEDDHYTAGTKRLVASVNGWKINLQICYDLRFPVWARQQQSAAYDILIYVANWPEARSHAWKTLLTARAIENQCYVIGVNRVGNDGHSIYHSGDTMIVSPLGEILYQKNKEEDIFTYTFHKEKLTEVRDKFPFGKDADDFNISI